MPMCQALAVAEEFVSLVLPVVEATEPRDANLASQLRRAATSAVLNTAEAWRRDGRDRANRFRIAAGECEEARVAVRIAVAWRYVAADVAAPSLAHADRLAAMLWRLRHPRR
ncbi:MAG: four helix bundle protein [Kofleriaceae bacterium]